MDVMKCLGGHMECLGGVRLQSFLTLFTRATPGTPASIVYYYCHKSCSCGWFIELYRTINENGHLLYFVNSQKFCYVLGFCSKS